LSDSIENVNFTTGEFEFNLTFDLWDIQRFVGEERYKQLTDEDLEKFKDIVFYDVENFVFNAFADYVTEKYGAAD
jgi:hypothetical protein